MASHKITFLYVTMLMLFFFFNSPSTYAAKRAAKPTKSYKVITKFCNKRSTIEDQEFCTRVLKSHPNSTTAKDNSSLLKISVDLAIRNLKKTREYMTNLFNSKGTRASLIPVLKDCIPAYDGCIGELRIVPLDLAADPPLASYDALLAHDELIKCEKSQNDSKIVEDSISSRYKIAYAYVQLCIDIAMSIP